MRTPHRIVAVLVPAFLSLTGCGDDDDPEPSRSEVVVMSRNLYLGAPIEPLFFAPAVGSDAFPAAVLELWRTVVASDIPARARAVASEIAAVQPDLVGLQEATLWRTQAPPDGPASEATAVEYDFVTLVQDELAARGFRYDAVATSTNFDEEFTASDGSVTALDVRMTDRDVILARSGVGVRDAADGRFETEALVVVAGAIPVRIPRGWTSVVANVAGAELRFVNTHLEIGALEPAQVAQAVELAALLDANPLPTIVVGDLNSDANPGGSDGTPTYGIVTGAGFTDLWPALHAGEPGLTCCQDPGLRNETSELQSRIDLVLFRGAFAPSSVDVVGEDPADRTAAGLWPSDHAGVVGVMRPPAGQAVLAR